MRFLEILNKANEWRKSIDWKNLSLWVRDSSLTTFLTLLGVVNSKKLSEVIPGLPDIDLSLYVNIPFWSKVMHLFATLFIVSVIFNRWVDKSTYPQTPIIKPPLQ